MMRHIENIPIVDLALCFTTLMRKIWDVRLQAMSAMAGFWVVCIYDTEEQAVEAWNRRVNDGKDTKEAETTQIIDGCCTACGAFMDCCEAAEYKYCPYCAKRIV